MPSPFKEPQLATYVLFFKSIFYNVKIKMCSHPCHPIVLVIPVILFTLVILATTVIPVNLVISDNLITPDNQSSYSFQSFQLSQSSQSPQSPSVIISHSQSSLVFPVVSVILVIPSHLSQKALLTLDIPVIHSHPCHPQSCQSSLIIPVTSAIPVISVIPSHPQSFQSSQASQSPQSFKSSSVIPTHPSHPQPFLITQVITVIPVILQ